MYQESRDENGDWLSIFEEPRGAASALFREMVEKFPDIHPYDLARAACSTLDYEAVCAHRRNKRKEEAWRPIERGASAAWESVSGALRDEEKENDK